MKNLKKILVALVLVALLISSVVTIAIAEASYTGTVEGAKQLLQTAIEATPSAGQSYADVRTSSLGKLHTYLLTVDPKEEGYDDVKYEYNAMTFKIAVELFGKLDSCKTEEEKAEALAAVYVYMESNPVIRSGNEDITYSTAYVCVNDGCGRQADFTLDQFYNGLTDSLECPGICKENKKLEYSTDPDKVHYYSDFEKAVNDESLDIASYLVAHLYAMAEDAAIGGTAGYYDVFKAQKAVEEYVLNVKPLEYKAPTSALYTGDIKAVEAFIENLSSDSSFEDLKKGLADAYSYMLQTPIMPTSDEYYTFITKYDGLGTALIEKLAENVEAAATPADKVAVLVSFREYLAGKEDVAGTQISQKVVNGFNELRSAMIDEYKNSGSTLESIEALDVAVPPVVYVTDFESFKTALEAAEAIGIDGQNTLSAIETLYSDYISKFAFDPANENYADLIGRYEQICVNYINSIYVDEIAAAKTINDKYAILSDFNAFVTEHAFCEAVSSAYENALETFINDAKVILDKIDPAKIPEYETPEKENATSTKFVLNAFCDDLVNSYNEYMNAEGENKAAALENMKNSANNIRLYILGSGVDTDAAYYEEFVGKYNEARNNVVAALFETVTSQENDDAKVAALADVGAYLAKTPITQAAIAEYNALVDELVADETVAAGMKIDSVFETVKALSADINAAGVNLEEALTKGLEIESYVSAGVDVTDPGYATFVADYTAAYDAIAEMIAVDLTYDLNNASLEDSVAKIEKYLTYIDTIYNENIVNAVANTLNEMKNVCAQMVSDIENGTGGVYEYISVYDYLLGIVAAYDNAESFDDRLVQFVKLYTEKNSTNFNTAVMMGASYAGFVSEYERVCDAFEAELVALLASSTSPNKLTANLQIVYGLISEIPFSEEVINSYNTTLENAMNANYASYADMIQTDCQSLGYVTPEGWYPYLTRIIIALEMSVKGEEIKDEFFVAYNILCGYAGVNGPKVIDFGVEGFYTTINKFNEVKSAIVEAKITEFDKAETLDDKYNTLVELGKFIEQYPFSYRIAECYEDIRLELREVYGKNSNLSFDKYQVLVDKIHNHMAKCPISLTLLDADGKSRYNTIETLIEAAEYSVVKGSLEYYNNLTGDTVLIYQNMLADKVNWYANEYGLDTYNESMLVAANLRFIFEEGLKKFDKILESMDNDEKARKIDSVGKYFVKNKYSSDLIKLYNSKYGTQFVAEKPEAATETGSLLDLGLLIESVNMSASFDAIRLKLSTVVEYVNNHTFSTADEQEATIAKIDAINEQIRKDTEKQIEKLDSRTKIDEYSYPLLSKYDFENSKLVSSGLSNGSGASQAIVTDNGNKYATLTTTNSATAYFNAPISDDSKGLVIEIDIMCPETANFQLYFYEGPSDCRCGTWLFKIKNGQLVYEGAYENYQQGVHDPIVLTPGEWTHFTVAFNVETRTVELLVDYVSLGTTPLLVGGTTTKWHGLTSLRFNNTATNTTTCYDNFTVYSGTSYRTLDRLNSLTTDDLFKLYVDSMLDETSSATSRLVAYYGALGYRDQASDASAAYKNKFDGFDPSAIIAEAQETHLSNLEELAKGIDVDSMTTTNVETVAAAISSVETYLDVNRQYIDQASDRFKAVNSKLVSAAEKSAWLANLAEYVKALSKIHRATTLASLKKHFETVEFYYDLCELDKAHNIEAAERDPACIAFIGKIGEDEHVTSNFKNITLADYYLKYLPLRMNEQLYYENSLKIMTCIEFVEKLVENKDAFATEEEYIAELLKVAEANADYVDPYLTVIRDILNADNYDKTVEEVDGAIEIFKVLDELFFARLQAKHLGVIEAQLNGYVETDSYIQKAGICAYIENYIAANNVDMTSEKGRQLMYALEVYKAELVSYKVDYEAILSANTEAFIGIVKKMEAYVSYKDLNPLYEEAITKYYYSMNVDSDEAKAAVEKFEKYQTMIQSWEENSAMFIGYANDVKSARRQAQKYRALVNCANYVDNVDTGIDGVAEALTIYNEALAEYNADIEPVRTEVAQISDVVCSFRTNSVSAMILAIIKNLIGR